jgi:hypothetical protein
MGLMRKNVSILEKTYCQTGADSLLSALMHRFWCAGGELYLP